MTIWFVRSDCPSASKPLSCRIGILLLCLSELDCGDYKLGRLTLSSLSGLFVVFLCFGFGVRRHIDLLAEIMCW